MKLFWPNSIFCNFKNGQKSIFELGKSLKLPNMQFHEKKCQNQFGLNPRAWVIWKDNGSVLPPANLAIFGQKAPIVAIFGQKSVNVAISSEIWVFLAKKRQGGDFQWNLEIFSQKAPMWLFPVKFDNLWQKSAISSEIRW